MILQPLVQHLRPCTNLHILSTLLKYKKHWAYNIHLVPAPEYMLLSLSLLELVQQTIGLVPVLPQQPSETTPNMVQHLMGHLQIHQ